MSYKTVVRASQLGKAYHIYKKPIDRLKQMLWRGRRIFYDEFWALRNIDLEVNQGETVGLIGRNGSGKSTFLQIVAGVLQQSCGNLEVDGRVAALLELGAGFNPEFTGKENVYLAASVLGLTTEQINARYQSIAEFADIGDFLDQPIKTYSSGMYARLAFAVAAHVDANILIIDEILAVGDAAFSQKCMRFIRQFKENGTILFVSHDTNAVINLCDRVVWLENGFVREIGVPKDVCRHYMAAVFAERETGDSFRIGGRRKNTREMLIANKQTDHRHDVLKESTLRNVIEVFNFDPDAPWFGKLGASITSVNLLDANGHPLPSLSGGEIVRLRVTAKATATINGVIIGFYIKDRLGQNLFGDNTYITYRNDPVQVEPGDEIMASFHFQMPFLPSGDFSITVALAEGTQEDHTQHHWVDEAMFFKVLSSHVARGLIGVPMLSIELERPHTTHEERSSAA